MILGLDRSDASLATVGESASSSSQELVFVLVVGGFVGQGFARQDGEREAVFPEADDLLVERDPGWAIDQVARSVSPIVRSPRSISRAER